MKRTLTNSGWTPLETLVMERAYAAGVQIDDISEDEVGKVWCTRFNIHVVEFMNDLRSANLELLGYVQGRDAHVRVRPLAPVTWEVMDPKSKLPNLPEDYDRGR